MMDALRLKNDIPVYIYKTNIAYNMLKNGEKRK